MKKTAFTEPISMIVDKLGLETDYALAKQIRVPRHFVTAERNRRQIARCPRQAPSRKGQHRPVFEAEGRDVEVLEALRKHGPINVGRLSALVETYTAPNRLQRLLDRMEVRGQVKWSVVRGCVVWSAVTKEPS